MRVSLLLFCIFSLFSSLSRGSSIPFSPIVRSYSVSDYNAGIQNWSIAQDDRGVMYIGNNKGLLEFDGNSWELHELPSRNIVRSVYIGKDGKIFVGSFEEFGYFERNSLDSLVYHSLKMKRKISGSIMMKSGRLRRHMGRLYFNLSVLCSFMMGIL